MIQSKLSNTAYLYSILILSFPVATAFIVNKFLGMFQDNWHWGLTVFLLLCGLVSIFVIIWGFFVEMNLRMAVIKITKDTIEVKQLLGFGTKRVFNTNDIDGFVIRDFKQRAQYHEYCYLIKDNKAIAVFSSLYYKNYMQVRNEMQQHLKLLK
ncbi:ABC transporter permease [Myroides sp. JBRI-B21084]|uniref:ABC transporter permease n=1 Tax=Myroides sp. JBRI-B21084 TaxID=3119977 RepID=UPI0026E1E7DA|nr:ABC transporter permease [Paenimyroides cloacae]WKW46112.1 ABC transporter permease [Paenimyroides cloacae]